MVGVEESGDTKVRLRSFTVKRLQCKVAKGDIPHRKVSFKELLKLNLPDWPLVLIGVILSALIGCLFPLMAILFSEVLRVSVLVSFLPHSPSLPFLLSPLRYLGLQTAR